MFVKYLLCLPIILGFSVQRRPFIKQVVTLSSIPNINNSLENFPDKNEEVPSELGVIQDTNNEIYLYSPITQMSCFQLKNKLRELDTKSQIFKIQYNVEAPPIHLHIQSQGGSLYHSIYIIDLITSMNTPVYTYIDGFAASAATLISVVGKKRFMTKNSLMLIHQLSGSDSGKYDELQDQMSNMKVLMDMIENIYLNHTSIQLNELEILLKKDIWLNAETCLKFGLVDEIL